MSAMEMFDVDIRHYSRKSMQWGRFSAAAATPTYQRQSCTFGVDTESHRQQAAHAYMVPDDLQVLYMTGKAFLGMLD
jgi:hypothetical protein